MRIVEALLIGALLITSPTACGQDATTSEQVPELAALLEQVDAAVVAGDDARTRQRVDALMAATREARDSGDLDSAQADKILTAATALLNGLPPNPPSSEESSSPVPEPQETDTTQPDKHHEHGKGKGKGRKH